MKLVLFILALTSSPLFARDFVVAAASSLTEVLADVAPEFEKQYRVKIRFNFDASSRLAKQIEQGARVDVFISADEEWSHYLQAKGIASPEKTVKLVSNDLVLACNKSHAYKIGAIQELKNLDFKRLAMAQETVPAGKYALEVLKNTGTYASVKKRIVTADHVRTVLSWIVKDEVDLGFVFASDAKLSPQVLTLALAPEKSHSKIIYPVSLLSKDATASAFYDYLQTPRVRESFVARGFKPWK